MPPLALAPPVPFTPPAVFIPAAVFVPPDAALLRPPLAVEAVPALGVPPATLRAPALPTAPPLVLEMVPVLLVHAPRNPRSAAALKLMES
jgi:hypothetical protein